MTRTHAHQELAGILFDAARVIDSLSELSIYCPFDTPAAFSARVIIRNTGNPTVGHDPPGVLQGQGHLGTDAIALEGLVPAFDLAVGLWVVGRGVDIRHAGDAADTGILARKAVLSGPGPGKSAGRAIKGGGWLPFS
jgi:hypothetical protein